MHSVERASIANGKIAQKRGKLTNFRFAFVLFTSLGKQANMQAMCSDYTWYVSACDGGKKTVSL